MSAGSPIDSDCPSVVIIVPEKCKIMLDAAARLLALCNQLVALNKDVTIDFSDCTTTLSYFDRIGFLDHLNNKATVLPKRPDVSRASIYMGNSKAVVEFGADDPARNNKELIVKLGDGFVHQSDARYETAASTVFGELIGNVKEHSQSPLPGFAALQKYRGKKKHIQTVVSDSGLGIANTLLPSLKEHHPNLYRHHNTPDFDVELVIATLSKGEISRFGAGRGLGFKSSREQAMKFDAQLSVRQVSFSLDFIYKDGELVKVNRRKALPKLLGTHLCFDFFVD